MSTQEYIRSITEMVPDDLTPLSPLPDNPQSSFSLFAVSWQTWVIIILLLALLGINIFAYLAKGTEDTASIIGQVFGPILKFFGYTAVTTTKQTIETTATGTKAGVDIVADTATGALDTIADTKQTYTPVQQQMQESGSNWQQDSLSKALNQSASTSSSPEQVMPNDPEVSSGKAGWCYIGEDNGVRTCSEIGVNDVCMSGDIFPTQAVCMNPKLRA